MWIRASNIALLAVLLFGPGPGRVAERDWGVSTVLQQRPGSRVGPGFSYGSSDRAQPTDAGTGKLGGSGR